MSVHLDPELKALMADDPTVAVLWQDATESRTALLAKAADEDVAGFKGKVPIRTHWELGRYACGSVLRLVLTIYDQPDRPYTFETFINVGSQEQRACVEQLLSQERLHLHFFNSRNEYVFTKAIGQAGQQRRQLKQLIELAERDRQTIGPAWDFDRAKQLFQTQHPL